MKKAVYTAIPPVELIDLAAKFTPGLFVPSWYSEYLESRYIEDFHIVVLDNGAYEGRTISWEELSEVAKKFTEIVDKVIVIYPDVIKDADKSLQLLERVDRISDDIVHLAVIQSPNVVEYASKVIEICGDKVDGFAIPVHFYRTYGSRKELLTKLNEHFPNYYIHMLGLDDYREARDCCRLCDSFDTSLPFSLSYKALGFKSRIQLPHIELNQNDLDIVRTLSQYNLAVLTRLLRG